MCNWKKWIWPGILAIVLLTALAMLMKSGSIEEDLRAKALGGLSANHEWAQVELDGRDLTLSGTAPSEDAASTALTIAKEAYDVRVVASDVVLLPVADPYQLSAVKTEAGITLEGSVPNEGLRASVVEAATAASDGASVTDNLSLARGAAEGFGALAGFGIGQLTEFSTGSASLSGSSLTIEGDAPSVEIYNAANAALAGDLPGDGTLAAANITAPTADPFTFSATKSADGIVLEGYSPSNEVRNTIVSAAENAAGGASVTDNLQLALGAPDGFDALAGFGVSQLADLTSGEVSLSGSSLSVKGAAPTVTIYNATNEALSGELPGGGTLALAEISPPTADPYVLTATKTADGINLDGFVPSEAARTIVLEAAKASNPGVAVTDNLKLALGNPDGFAALSDFGVAQLGQLSSGEASLVGMDLSIKGEAATFEDFDAITKALSERVPAGGNLAMHEVIRPSVSPYVFSATEGEGGITLDGFVPDEPTRNALVSAAGAASDGAVNDNLQIARGAPAGFSEMAGFGLARLGEFSTGSVSLSDSALSVRGTALSPEAYAAASAAMAGDIPGGGNIIDAQITRSTVSPYTFTATSNESSMVLSGYVGSEAEQQSAVRYATENNPGVEIVDQLVIANGAPDGVNWSDANTLAISAAVQLSSGSASISDSGYSVEGIAKTPAAHDAVKGTANGDLPAGLELAREDVRLPVADPYLWSLTSQEGVNPVLSGFVPDAGFSETNEAEVADILPGDLPVENNLERAGGAPEGLKGATSLAIRAVSGLINGKAEISGTKLMVIGEAPTEEIANAVRASVEGDLPPGFTGRHDISVRPAPPMEPEPTVEPEPVDEPEPVAAAQPMPTVEACQADLTAALQSETIQFETNKSVIREGSFGLLDRLSQIVKVCPAATVEIGGHTDSDGSDAYNQALSEDRANAVRSYLVRNGVFVGRMNAVGYGEQKPIADNENDEGKARNRRIEFTVIR